MLMIIINIVNVKKSYGKLMSFKSYMANDFKYILEQVLANSRFVINKLFV